MSCVILTDIQNTKLSHAAHFTPLVSAPMGCAATLSITMRKKLITPCPVPPLVRHPPLQAFPSSHLAPSALTGLLLSDIASALLGFPLPPSQPFSLPLTLDLLLPQLPSHVLHRPRLLPALTLLTSFLMPSWRWTLPLRPPLSTSSNPPWSRPLQQILGLHSCLPQTLAVLHVGCLRMPPLPWGRVQVLQKCFRGHWVPEVCPIPLCRTRTRSRIGAALPARSVALNPAVACMMLMADD